MGNDDELTDEEIKEIYELRNIAVVGLSKDVEKQSHRVAAYLMTKKYRIIPVNPTAERILGKKVYAKLSEIEEPIDIVDIFRPSEDVMPIVEQAIEKKAKVIWMQEGIVNEEAAKMARGAGIKVVMNRCIMKEHKRLFGN
jgi:predicted CoA-binding protein